jgi:hypothetical protein
LLLEVAVVVRAVGALEDCLQAMLALRLAHHILSLLVVVGLLVHPAQTVATLFLMLQVLRQPQVVLLLWAVVVEPVLVILVMALLVALAAAAV